ncbi:MAG TPA: hypothetical protein VFM79_03565, partial [Pelobium sp.]|nr:hypothetical protein [Pelobium sp.]
METTLLSLKKSSNRSGAVYFGVFKLIFLVLLSSNLFAQGFMSVEEEGSGIQGGIFISNETTTSEGTIKLRWENIDVNTGGCTSSGTVYHRIGIIGESTGGELSGVFALDPGDVGGQSGERILGDIGPSRDYSINIKFQWGKTGTGCDRKYYTQGFNGKTAKLRAPKNVSVSYFADNSLGRLLPVIKWEKNSGYSDDKLNYQIVRIAPDSSKTTIATLAGNILSFKDEENLPIGNYKYSIKTLLSDSAPSTWNRASEASEDAVISESIAITGQLTASQDQRNVIKLSWSSFNAVKGIDAINIYRNGELLTDLSKTAKNYNDNDVVPGKYYTYSLGFVSDGNTGLDVNNFRTKSMIGRSLPNGKLSGYVKGRTNAGVEGVIINAFSKTKLADGSGGSDSVYHYSAVTGPDGYYEIPDIYYADEAEYCLKPTFPGYNKKRFDPDSLFRKLVLDDYNLKNINFTDTASLAISGNVYFTAITDSNNVAIKLPLEGAEVWLDGKNSNVLSKADGSYSVSVLQSGNHSVELKFKDHPIFVPATTNPVRNILVNSLVNNIDFEDTKTDTLQIKVAASCDAPIGENVNVIVNSKSNGVTSAGESLKYNQKFTIRSADFQNTLHPNQTESGVINLILPATAYQAQVSLIKEKDAQGQPIINSNKLEYFKQNYTLLEANLSARDTIVDSVRYASITQITPTRQDTVFKDSIIKTAPLHNLSFIYYNNLRLKINNDNPIFTDSVFFASAGKNKLLLEQNDKPIVNIKIQETYSYRGITYNCDLDTGRVFIFDNISDIVSRQDFMLDSTGVVKYRLNVGKPVLEAPFEKSIQIVAKVGARETSKNFNVVVLGQRPRNSTFVTKTPAIPLFVLHDPPGDNSFATIQKGTSISTTRTAALSFGGGAEVYTDLKVGAGVNIPFAGKTGAAVRFNASVDGGADRNSSKTLTVTTTFDESFSTSSDESLVGHDGDVYVGASLNMIYALTDVIDYDAEKKDIKRDTSLAIDYNGFNTTFLYTEHQIKNTIIPQLETLYSISRSTYEKANQKYKAG